MALSLRQHIYDTQATALKRAVQEMGLNAAQASSLLDWTLPLVLAHLVSLNQRHGTGLVLALLNTRPVDGLWQTLDQGEWISQLQQQLPADALVLEMASQHIVSAVLAEVFELVDAASLGEEGLDELLVGQPEHLQGQAPDWVWQLSGLTSLCGQAATVVDPSEALDLAAGIASLNQLVRQAVKHSHSATSSESPMSSIDIDHSAQQQHDEHPAVLLVAQRDAGQLTRVLEPLIAVAILGLLYALFTYSDAPSAAAAMAVTAAPIATSAEESVLIPTLLADESQLPPMSTPSNTAVDGSGTAAPDTLSEAQRTGAQALQFSDNSLSP